MSAPKPRHGIILVADDNESNRELLSSLVTDEGYQVISATDGQQALEQMSADSIAVVHGYEPVQPAGSAG